jgi:chromosome segregation ATPase
MDPLSITASVLTVAAAAKQLGSAFAELRAIHTELPGRLHALNNEVSDIEVVLYQVAAVLSERSVLPQSAQMNIPPLLELARAKLSELKAIVDRLSAIGATKGILSRASAWRKVQARLQALQEDIKTVKCSLNIMLGASNSYAYHSSCS